MILAKSLNPFTKKCLCPVIRNLHRGSEDGSTTLRNVSKSLFNVGKVRLENQKTSTNVYEHFADPTVVLENRKQSEKLKDFEEIHAVTVNFGSPEMADQMSGAIYMHASMVEDKCSQCLRLSEDIPTYSITDLTTCLTSMGWWSSQASHSLALREVVTKLDLTCVDRLASLHFSLQDQLRLAYQWQSLLFQHKAQFPKELLQTMSVSVLQSSLPVLVSFLLILSSVELKEKNLVRVSGKEVSDKLESALPFLTEAELTACYSGLRRMGEGEEGVRVWLHSKFGYRLE